MSQNSSVRLPFYSSHYLKYDKSKISAKYHRILMSRFWEIVFRVPLLFRRHVCLSNLKHLRSREMLLTTRKTVFSHLNWVNKQSSCLPGLNGTSKIFFIIIISLFQTAFTLSQWEKQIVRVKFSGRLHSFFFHTNFFVICFNSIQFNFSFLFAPYK